MKKKSQFRYRFLQKANFLMFLLLGIFAFSQTKISGSVIDKTTGKPLSGVEIFINNKEKLIQKDVSIFHFTLPNGLKVEINGKILLNRPEDRIKKRFRKYW